MKQINKPKLYLPGRGQSDIYPLLALTRPIRWDVIKSNYDLMLKHATAIRVGTASTEAILRRFTKDVTHPAYAAMLEVGRAQRTIFLARWLRDRDLQRETTPGSTWWRTTTSWAIGSASYQVHSLGPRRFPGCGGLLREKGSSGEEML